MDPTRVDQSGAAKTRVETRADQSPPNSPAPTRVDTGADDPAAEEPRRSRGSVDATVSAAGTGPVGGRAGQPEKVGPYVITKLLGAGGMGSVYLGHSENDGSLAAVKVLPASLAREPGFIERFDREISALEKLTNPHVVELLGHGVETLPDGSSLHFYAMEYVAGETLSERLRREKRLPWEDVIDIGVQVCTALKSAHDAGVIHRDLKPSNIILREDGQVKLADFGVAQVFASTKLTVTGGIIGTAEYMSPEQAEGRRVTKQSDIYSLGALMYVALTGRPPFPGRNPVEIAQKHRTGQFDAPRRWVAEIPHWFDEIVCKCLSKQPEERYPDARILGKRLEEVPRKLELARSELTGDRTAATADANGAPRDDGGGATFAAEMVRAELEQERRGSFPRRLLDNVWVLVLLLAALGGIAYVMTRERPVDADELFARGQELMEQKSLQGMRTARDDYFLPLLEINEERWGPQVEPLLRKIELAEVTRGTRSLTGSTKPTTEPQRLLHFALEQRRDGDVQGADDTLAALRELVRHEESQQDLVAEIDNIRGELVVQLAELKRDVFIEERRALADVLRGEGREEEAKRLLDALRTVYGDTSPKETSTGETSATGEE